MGRKDVSSLRIISTVPSITELLHDLGCEDEVVGITKFCVHPDHWFRTKTRIGGTKTLHLEKIRTLSPELIICNKEENVKEQIEALSAFSKIFVSDIKTLEDNLQLIPELGSLCHKRMTAIRIEKELQSTINSIKSLTETTAAYLIWQDPYMTVGHDTYIHNFMNQCGLKNVFSDKARYPQTSLDELKWLRPELILLSSEPFPFKAKHAEYISDALPDSKVVCVDGEVFSWYGTRLIKKIDYLNELLASFELNPS